MQLLNQIRACTLCEQSLPLGPNPVLQVNKHSKILIAGQAPSLSVHKTNRLFNDASGQRLRAWLNVDEEQFYNANNFAIIPMAFCYPGKGKSGDLPPPATCAKTWHHDLLGQLNNIKLKIIIGQHAQRFHLEKDKSLTEQVNKWNTLLPAQIVLPHPSPRNQMWVKRHPWFERDVLPALRARVKEALEE
ncbi:uracil-DNA glycosylase family protein [Pseudoalteromonas sp. JBTF-M23]|uniref:Uracil-DNA glycosylase family protein n=1 Tax=Pseudoalteromonas caenipelagi TaxID=2726988 RepID=A0A849VCY7_9GAMM|nr:uracil-DNA glycosylase family protein [Pseudoalteromonas caenipelagi]NOU50423.1 uracil-DNA glycosylase family protein [Pseudoalteromonas caenipelagi]